MKIKFLFYKLYDNNTDFSLLQALNDVQTFLSSLFSNNSKFTGVIFQIILENEGKFTSFTNMLRVNKDELHLVTQKLQQMYNFNIVKYQSVVFTNVLIKYHLFDKTNIKHNIKLIDLISINPTVIAEYKDNPHLISFAKNPETGANPAIKVKWYRDLNFAKFKFTKFINSSLPEQVRRVFGNNAITIKLVNNNNSPIPKILPGLWQIVNFILRIIFLFYFSIPPPPSHKLKHARDNRLIVLQKIGTILTHVLYKRIEKKNFIHRRIG